MRPTQAHASRLARSTWQEESQSRFGIKKTTRLSIRCIMPTQRSDCTRLAHGEKHPISRVLFQFGEVIAHLAQRKLERLEGAECRLEL